MIVAEQVAAALEGAVVTNAVNIPVIRAEDLELLGPYIPLAAKLGRLAMELAGGRAERITLSYYGALAGYDTRLLTVAALNGAFQGRSEQPVNYVNAPVIAAERGIEVLEERRRASRDFTNLVRVEVRSNGDQVRVAGTTIGTENRQWLVSAMGFELEMELAPLLVFFRYDDLPGRDRPRRDALRRGRRQHREHGRLPHAAGRQGADGAFHRHRAAPRAGRDRARPGLRRRPRDQPHGVSRFRSRGKSVVSRMFLAPTSRAIQRSCPSAKPPCGGIPYLNACR